MSNKKQWRLEGKGRSGRDYGGFHQWYTPPKPQEPVWRFELGEEYHRHELTVYEELAEKLAATAKQMFEHQEPLAPLDWCTTHLLATFTPTLTKATHNGVVIGFRYWGVTADYKLASIAEVAKTHIWQPGVNAAKCMHSEPYFRIPWGYIEAHDAPGRLCHCGFNLRGAPSSLVDDISANTIAREDAILGACLAWGRRLFHGNSGCRAEYARPILLAYDPTWTHAKQRLVQGLAEDYDCRAVPVSYPNVEAGVCEPLLQHAREYGKLISEMET